MKRFRDRFPHMRKPVPKFNRAMHRGRTPPRMTAKITAPPGTSGGGEERDASEAGSEKSRPTNYGAADWSLFPRFEVRKRFATSSGQDRKAVPCLNGRTGANPKAASVERSPENCLRTVREYPVVRTTAPCRTPVKRCFRPGLPHCRLLPKRAPPTVRATVRIPLKTPFGSPPAFPSAKLVFRIELSCRGSPHRSREAIRLSFRGRFRAHSHRDTGRNAPGSGRFERIRKEGGRPRRPRRGIHTQIQYPYLRRFASRVERPEASSKVRVRHAEALVRSCAFNKDGCRRNDNRSNGLQLPFERLFFVRLCHRPVARARFIGAFRLCISDAGRFSVYRRPAAAGVIPPLRIWRGCGADRRCGPCTRRYNRPTAAAAR